jgi:hypothetical protein
MLCARKVWQADVLSSMSPFSYAWLTKHSGSFGCESLRSGRHRRYASVASAFFRPQQLIDTPIAATFSHNL